MTLRYRPWPCSLIILAVLTSPAVAQQARFPATPEDAAWAKAMERMDQCAATGLNAIDPVLKQHFDPVFADARGAAKPFAEDLLGWRGKAMYLDCLTQPAFRQVDRKLYEWFGLGNAGHWLPPEVDALLPDPFHDHIRCRLEVKVIDINRLRKAVDGAMAEYAAKLQAEENRLIVALRADLPDEALAGKLALPVLPAFATACPSMDQAVEAIASSARTDVGVLIAREAASWFLGNKAGELLNRRDDHFIKKTAINLMAGKTVDDTLKGAIDISGYDPEARIVGHVHTALDQLRLLTLEGDAEERQLYRGLYTFSLDYPDAEVREACSKALKALEQHGNPGLRVLMEAMYNRREVALHFALYRQIYGPKADTTRLYGIDPAKSTPRGDILKFAKAVLDDYQED
ncbi:hypothetical protein [Planctomyces sp. SH-PL62]|uniref:hypothetical protein n=1 Tax=Planctomyces sp. SH-PL62 TaxID=1636152 RepID=UPI00078BAA8E|nr:hypothetical protein [Planctomyces sp. SH-PL62]AMV40256.1 hypothetical protein VT85_22685 [Planctomyces sp. SH-PL62]